MTWELKQAERLAQKWRAGDGAAWLPLEDLIKKRLAEDIEKWLIGMDANDVAWARDNCLEVFKDLQTRQRFIFEKRTNFQEICAHALRRVITEIARRLAEIEP